MSKFAALVMAAGITVAAYAVMTAPGCYDPNKPAPCDPRCTDPPMAAHDAGADRE